MNNIVNVILISFVLILAAAFLRFEKKSAAAEKIVLIAVLSALSAAGRWLFTAIPSVQPSSFIIIMTGIVLGAQTGFMTGALTAFLSSLLMGFGPWTPFQMAAWGLMGGIAGAFCVPLLKYKSLRLAYGAVWGILFGWIMNLWMLVSLGLADASLAQIAGVYAASLVFDLMHSSANVLLIFVAGDKFIKILSRVAVKYGLASRGGVH